ncbi:hypothetical protein BDV06DRAFT_220839 [Aspergillus oleicola]
MVSWTAENNTRLIAALLAANPGIKLDYNAIAAMFGQGTTYDTIEYRFRIYRKAAEKLKVEAANNGVSLDKIPRGRQTTRTPQTPRSSGNRIAKTSASASTSAGKGRKNNAKGFSTPTKSARKRTGGMSLLQPILVHSDEEDTEDEGEAKEEDDMCKFKTEMETAGVIPSIEDSGIEGAAANTQLREGLVTAVKEEDVFTVASGRGLPLSRSHIMAGPPADSDDDMCMDSGGISPTPQRHGRRRSPSRSRPSRAHGTPFALNRNRIIADDEDEEELMA